MEIGIGSIVVKLEMWRLSVTVMNDRLAPWIRWKSGFHIPSLAVVPNPGAKCYRGTM
jgi:hypothetical protein